MDVCGIGYVNSSVYIFTVDFEPLVPMCMPVDQSHIQ